MAFFACIARDIFDCGLVFHPIYCVDPSYVGRNALSAGLVESAEAWRWSSLWARSRGPEELRRILCDWPGGRPAGWAGYVNEAITKAELSRLKASEERGRPYGADRWVGRMVSELGLEYTVRDPWRPAKAKEK